MSKESPEVVPRLGDPVEEPPLKFWVRFSLRSLLVFMLAAGLFGAAMGVRYQRTKWQKTVVARLTPFGVSPGWRAGNVVQLSFSGRAFNNEALEHLREFPQLERVVLIDTNANAETLKRLTAFELTTLMVLNAPLEDEGLQHLKAFKKLEVLWLNSTAITDEGLQQLKVLTTLKRLSLSETGVGDEGLEHLRPMTNLEALFLQSTKATAEGVDSLKQSLPNVRIVFE